MNAHQRLLSFAALVGVTLLLGNCSSTSTGTHTPPSTDAGSSTFACSSLTNEPNPVGATELLSTAPPTLTGGSMVDGLYFLTAFTVYPDANASSVDAGDGGASAGDGGAQPVSGASLQEALMISGTTINVVRRDGGVHDTVQTFETSVSGSSVSFTPTCGETADASVVTYSFEAGPDTLIYYVPGAEWLLTFKRQ